MTQSTTFYDAHIHFFYQCPEGDLMQTFEDLEKEGLAGFDALIFAEVPRAMETVFSMVPGAYHRNITPQVLENMRDPFRAIQDAAPLKIVPFADARFMERDPEEKLRALKERGFQGLKLLYVPQEEADLQIKGMGVAFGRSLKQSEKITSRLIETAASLGMRVLLHADLRKYGDFVTEMVRAHPETHFNIPHFGSSRKAMASLLEHASNCYSDLSSLMPAMEKDPESYRAFINDFQDRVLFGSDAVIGRPEQVRSSMAFLREFWEEGEVLEKLSYRNYLAFHGHDVARREGLQAG